jgi:hypothetical protein
MSARKRDVSHARTFTNSARNSPLPDRAFHTRAFHTIDEYDAIGSPLETMLATCS